MMSRGVIKRRKAPQNVITDWDFSWVTKTNAKTVWIYELVRQSNVNSWAAPDMPSGCSTLLRKALSSPYRTLTGKELEPFHNRDIEPQPYFKENGVVSDKATNRILFATPDRKPQGFNLRFTFEIHPHVRPQHARRYLLRWFDAQVVPKLSLPDLRRGPKSDHISWLADLAIYRAAKAGFTFSQMEEAVKDFLPQGFHAKSLFSSRTHQTDAKRRTRKRLQDVGERSTLVSKFGVES